MLAECECERWQNLRRFLVVSCHHNFRPENYEHTCSTRTESGKELSVGRPMYNIEDVLL